MANLPNSKLDVITPVALVLKELISQFKIEMPDTTFVYDPALNYESAIKASIKNSMSNGADTLGSSGDSPLKRLFIFNREPLMTATDTGMSHRATAKSYNVRNKKDGVVIGGHSFDACNAVFQMPFMYYSSSMADLEAFEVSYVTKSGVSASPNISVSFPNLNALVDQDSPLAYRLDYEELSSIIVEVDGKKTLAVTGNIKVTGWYYTYRMPISVIEKIHMEINSFYKEVLASELIQ